MTESAKNNNAVTAQHKQLKVTRRGMLKLAVRSGIGIMGLNLGSLAWARTIEPDWVDVNHIRLRLPRLGAAFHGFRVVQISDIHIDDWMTRSRLSHIVRLVNQQNPDLVAITGDFVTHYPRKYVDALTDCFSKLTPRHAAAAVLGNHDHWTNATLMRQMIRKSGMIDLNNAVHTLRRGKDVLHIAGVDDPWMRKARLDEVLPQLKAPGAAILLAHEPDFADDYAKYGVFDLQLSGHSHGGQVTLPGVGPLVLPPKGLKYHTGRYQVQDMTLYTNRGVGMVRPYVRFNCRPEIAVFTLEARNV